MNTPDLVRWFSDPMLGWRGASRYYSEGSEKDTVVFAVEALQVHATPAADGAGE